MKKALLENWVVITNDKDFGELIFRDNYAHHGIIFLRLSNERSTNKIECLKRLLAEFMEEISGQFVVVTDSNVRIVKRPDL